MKFKKLLVLILVSCTILAGDNSTIYNLMQLSQSINDVEFQQRSDMSYDENIQELIHMSSISEKLIKNGSDYANKLKKKDRSSKPVTGEDLSVMKLLTRNLILQIDRLSELSKHYVNLSKDEEYQGDVLKDNLIKHAIALNTLHIYMNTYESFFTNYDLKKVVREIVKIIDDKKEREVLKNFSNIAGDKKYRALLKKLTNNFIEFRELYLNQGDKEIKKLISIIDGYNYSKIILEDDIPKMSTFSIGSWFVEIFSKLTNFISGLFGNLVGQVRFRHGHMHSNKIATDYLYNTLRPLDIIAEKTPFAATDFFIPGHFGHIAIWLGTEDQLRSAGLWNNEKLKPYHEQIRQGKTILESIRPGSRLVSLEEFLEIDEITIVREKDILNNKISANIILEVALEQLHKKYDFNFDVATLDKVVCSEVPYHAFGHKTWLTSYIFGRHTISPDEIIENAYTHGSNIEFVTSIYANKEGEVFKVYKEEMGKNLGLRLDLDASSEHHNEIYSKEVKKCRLVKIRNHHGNNNSNRRKYRYYKKCKTNDQLLFYSN